MLQSTRGRVTPVLDVIKACRDGRSILSFYFPNSTAQKRGVEISQLWQTLRMTARDVPDGRRFLKCAWTISDKLR
jgi:hypothetical protein